MAATATEALHICDGCLSTILCSKGALTVNWKWKHYSGTGWKLLLCPECAPKEGE